MPDGCNDDEFTWSKDKDRDLDERKHAYVCHAEMNAIINRNSVSLKDCTIYVSLFPCNECAKMIIQSGIKKVVYYSDKKKTQASYKASKKMFEAAKVEYKQHETSTTKLEIDFETINTAELPKETRKLQNENRTKSEKNLKCKGHESVSSVLTTEKTTPPKRRRKSN